MPMLTPAERSKLLRRLKRGPRLRRKQLAKYLLEQCRKAKQ